MAHAREKLLALFEETGAERFETLAAWARGAGLPSRLAAYYADRSPDSWWAVAFNTYRRNANGSPAHDA